MHDLENCTRDSLGCSTGVLPRVCFSTKTQEEIDLGFWETAHLPLP